MNKKMMNKIFAVLILAVVVFIGKMTDTNEEKTSSTYNQTSTTSITENSLNSVDKAYKSKKSDVQVKGSGRVVKVLRDDTKGHKHQKFILKLESGTSILIAHNIDLAPRIKDISKGDVIEFYGEYEYNSKGGVVHWTHHDPGKRHIDGWLKSKGQVYE